MIIETSANQVFKVKPAADIEHAWLGVELNRRTLQPKKNAREILVRKAGCKVLQP
jgi:hypothetical protein